MPYGFVPAPSNFLLDLRPSSANHPRTRAIIFNDLHNPTGAVSPRAEIEALAELCLKHDLYVLSDEAYWDIRYCRCAALHRSPCRAWLSAPSSSTRSPRSSR